MKPRRVFVTLELVSMHPVSKLRNKDYWNNFFNIAVLQAQANVPRNAVFDPKNPKHLAELRWPPRTQFNPPKASKRAKRRRRK